METLLVRPSKKTTKCQNNSFNEEDTQYMIRRANELVEKPERDEKFLKGLDKKNLSTYKSYTALFRKYLINLNSVCKSRPKKVAKALERTMALWKTIWAFKVEHGYL